MMQFRCPHCQHVLEVDKPTETLLCPACEQWCRIPVPQEFTLEREEVLDVLPARSAPPRTPTHAPREADYRRGMTSPEPPPAPAEVARDPRLDIPPLRFLDERDVEDVEMEIVEDGEQRRRRRRRRRRRSFGAVNLDFGFISLPLILLILLAPCGLFCTILSFIIHPAAGVGCLLMMGGGIWFILIVAEDGLVPVLLVTFVPFYAWYYAIANWDRVALPFLLQMLGGIGFTISLVVAGQRAREKGDSTTPPPIVRYAINSRSGVPHGASANGRPSRSVNSRSGSMPRQV